MIAMEIEVEDGRVHVALRGELDADNAPTFLQRVNAAHEAYADVEIGIGNLEFIDSSGLSALLKLRDTVIAGGGSFAVTGPTPAVRRVFEIAGLLDAFGLS